MDWKDATARVVVAGCEPAREDVAMVLGWSGGEVAGLLAAAVREVVVVDPEAPPPDLPANLTWRRAPLSAVAAVPGLSVVVAHWTLRRRPKEDQRRIIEAVGRLMPERGLFVVGDIIWSLPFETIDEPEQYGEDVANAPTAAELEGWIREAGFLPDLHRFGPAVGVMIALKAAR